MSENVKLSGAAAQWADSRVSKGGFLNRRDYLERLIEKDRIREEKVWNLQRLLQEGIDSGVSDASLEDIWAEAMARTTQDG